MVGNQSPVEKHPKAEKERDVERQLHQHEQPSSPTPSRKELEFLQSLVSLGSTGKEMKRTPVISGIVVLIYVFFCVKIIIGVVSLQTCAIGGVIPLYLIIAGVTGITVKLLFDTTNKYLLRVLIALAGFYCVWHIICSVLIFKEYHPNYDPEDGPYCSRFTYLVAFWSLILQYTVLLVFMLLCICNCLMHSE